MSTALASFFRVYLIPRVLGGALVLLGMPVALGRPVSGKSIDSLAGGQRPAPETALVETDPELMTSRFFWDRRRASYPALVYGGLPPLRIGPGTVRVRAAPKPVSLALEKPIEVEPAPKPEPMEIPKAPKLPDPVVGEQIERRDEVIIPAPPASAPGSIRLIPDDMRGADNFRDLILRFDLPAPPAQAPKSAATYEQK